MNIRQQLYKKYRLEGYSKYTSARKAGYSHNYAAHQAKRLEKVVNMDYWLEKAGLTDTILAQHAKEGLNANKVISATIIYGKEREADSKTNDFIEVPDWHARHKYLETILKLGGKMREVPLIDKSVRIEHNQFFNSIIAKPKLADDENRIKPYAHKN